MVVMVGSWWKANNHQWWKVWWKYPPKGGYFNSTTHFSPHATGRSFHLIVKVVGMGNCKPRVAIEQFVDGGIRESDPGPKSGGATPPPGGVQPDATLANPDALAMRQGSEPRPRTA